MILRELAGAIYPVDDSARLWSCVCVDADEIVEFDFRDGFFFSWKIGSISSCFVPTDSADLPSCWMITVAGVLP